MSRLQIHAEKWRTVTGCVEVMGKPMEEPDRGRQGKTRPDER